MDNYHVLENPRPKRFIDARSGGGVQKAPILIALAVVAAAAMLVSTTPTGQGFGPEDVALPSATILERHAVEAAEGDSPPMALSVSWSLDPMTPGREGAAVIKVSNFGSAAALVSSPGIVWADGSSSVMDSYAIVEPAGSATLVILAVAPLSAQTFTLQADVATQGEDGFRSSGRMSWRSAEPVRLLAPSDAEGQDVRLNSGPFLLKMRGAMGPAPRELVDDVMGAAPGGYSVLQIAAAFDAVKSSVQYASETEGRDEWQSPMATYRSGAGDCEDYAVLLCSVIDDLGGTARVNVVDGHAFASVLVAVDAAGLDAANASLASWYGSDAVDAKYMQDALGFWLVLDASASAYAGGLPAQAALTDGGWTVLGGHLWELDYIA